MWPRARPAGVIAAGYYTESRSRLCAKSRLNEIRSQLLIHRRAFNRVLRSERTASDQKSPSAFDCICGDAAPEKMQQIEIAMLGVHAGATQLDHFAAQWFVGREVKLALAVIADIRCGTRAGLQSICADDFASRQLFDDQVIAELVEWIDVGSGGIRFGQSFAELEIENLKPQPLGATQFVRASRQSRRVFRLPRLRFPDGSVCFGQNH